MGTLTAFAGIEHGIGEILQGNRPPGGIWILSWPESTLFRSVGGEPAMTVIPNLLITGVLAILFSLAFFTWTIQFAQRKPGGIVLILFSVILLLVGGGIFPPVLGLMTGLTALGIRPSLAWPRTYLSPGLQRFMSRVWPWLFGITIIAWLALFPGSILLDYFFSINVLDFILTLIISAFGFLILTILCGFVRDSQQSAINL